ncbi:ABC transporter ATP-binding protein [Erythrobacter sp. JK5]|uniref:ABC transporter ATP-binding protein n=1 Tax=Erythrobacter sp. JK5 TaxID=2829500 RepID=UPI001BA92800|nr:ABC transporter ATP-binding protein [Erythrobacter sp. JK5]QUL38052.1 ABC transporter ATP-binding protein [Erythrobacter sp. JK5]
MSLEFRHIAHAYGSVRALEDISFTAPEGEITCLLGASGCGKSTLLNLAAGLLPVQQGAILIGGELLAGESVSPPPEKRPVGLVFQDGALFPHMTIAKNIAFGLPRGSEVDSWLDRVGLGGLGGRYPHELSGGQQQRAALARAMAPGPRVLLMDEPFASVDSVLRRRLRRECRTLLRERGATVVLVTHDPEEALDIGDRIAVMEAGRIVQFGTPQELHDRPATAAVGAIFRGAQVIAATRGDAGLVTAFGTWPLASVAGALPESRDLDLLVHAVALDLEEDEAGLEVRDRHALGDVTRVVLADDSGSEITLLSDRPAAAPRYRVAPRPGSVRAFARP